jgi:transglutaminase-like putative cysteine protease
MFQVLRRLAVAASILALVSPAPAQFVDAPKVETPKTEAKPTEPQAGPVQAAEKPAGAQTQKWEFGTSVRATGGPCAGLLGTFAVPTDWPEQQVKAVGEQISAGVQHRYRTTDGLKQMVFNLPQLNTGGAAECFVTFETTRLPQKPPLDPGRLIIPKELPAEIKKFLGPSPLIEATNAKVRSMAKELTADKETAWEQVQAILDGVRKKIELQKGMTRLVEKSVDDKTAEGGRRKIAATETLDEKDQTKGAAAALRDGWAFREDMTAAFVALCRAAKVPARMVWSMDFCYAEFYLEDSVADEPAEAAQKTAKPKKTAKKAAKGAWYPAIVIDSAELGACADARPIMQKGDNIKVPEEAAVQRYVKEFLRGKGGGGGRPTVEFRRRHVD